MNLFFINIAYASAVQQGESLSQFIFNVNKLLIKPLIVFLFALAVVFFVYGILEFLLNQEDEEKKSQGKSHMIWGILGIVIMMSALTLMNLVVNSFAIKGVNVNTGKIDLPPDK